MDEMQFTDLVSQLRRIAGALEGCEKHLAEIAERVEVEELL